MATNNGDRTATTEGDGGRLPDTTEAVPSAREAVPSGFGRSALRFVVRAAAAGAAAALLSAMALQTAPFRFDPEAGGLHVEGASLVQIEEVELVFAPDAGRSLAAVDVEEKLDQMHSIPWVLGARVRRVWPDSVHVTVTEREPIAFLRLSESKGVCMIDSHGEILDLRGAGERSLPVLSGIDRAMPLEERLGRLRLFESVMEVFADAGSELAAGVSEIDVSDGRNAVVFTKHQDRMVRLQMGDRHLRHRLEVFLNYIDAWRSEFGPMESVDLRFDKQVAVRPVPPEEGRG